MTERAHGSVRVMVTRPATLGKDPMRPSGCCPLLPVLLFPLKMLSPYERLILFSLFMPIFTAGAFAKRSMMRPQLCKSRQ